MKYNLTGYFSGVSHFKATSHTWRHNDSGLHMQICGLSRSMGLCNITSTIQVCGAMRIYFMILVSQLHDIVYFVKLYLQNWASKAFAMVGSVRKRGESHRQCIDGNNSRKRCATNATGNRLNFDQTIGNILCYRKKLNLWLTIYLRKLNKNKKKMRPIYPCSLLLFSKFYFFHIFSNFSPFKSNFSFFFLFCLFVCLIDYCKMTSFFVNFNLSKNNKRNKNWIPSNTMKIKWTTFPSKLKVGFNFINYLTVLCFVRVRVSTNAIQINFRF